jgi:uncharacterized protein YecE (DUF72 family)
MPPRQLPLFGDADEPAPVAGGVRRAAPPVAPVPTDDEALRLAGDLPGPVHLGTSSWSFPGWTGLVYAAREGRPESEQRLARTGLAAYAACALFRTVSLDRTFYAPLSREEFAGYAAQVPTSFRFVVKAPAAFTDPVIRTGAGRSPAGDNPSFLDAAAATAAFVQPAVAGLGAKAGPLVFQFPPLGRLVRDPARLAARIAAFVAVLPRGPLYAVELRDPECVTPTTARVLADAGAVPCLAVHARMPAVAEQVQLLGGLPAGPLVVRWNLHAGLAYEEAKGHYFPFDRLVDEDLPARGALAGLAAAVAARGDLVFITINNKAEGSAPLSVRALARMIVGHAGA